MMQLESQTKDSSSGARFQPKLKIGQPGDKYEQEADAVADSVMLMGERENMRMQPLEEEDKMQPKLQMQPIEEEEEMLQTKPGAGAGFASSEIDQQINTTKGNGRPLAPESSHFMGNAFGADFSGVKIHTDTNAVQMNQQLGARAFTYGNNIYFNNGEYNPESSNGKRLLAHELTHVTQQRPESLASKKQIEDSNLSNHLQRKEDMIQKDGGTTAAVAALAYQITSEVLSSSGGGSDIDLTVDEMTGMFYGRSATAAGQSSQTAPSTRKSHVFSYLLESVLFRSNLIELTLRMDYEVDSYGVGNISFAIESINDAAGWGGRFTANLTPMDSSGFGAVRLTVSFDTSGLGTSASGSFTYVIYPFGVYLIREVGDTGDYLGMQDSHRNVVI
jgi:hypothetical protein